MGGIETHVFEVSRRMVARGHHVTVLTTDQRGDLPARETVDGVAIRRVRAAPWSGDALLAPGLWRAVADHPCDIAHVQGFHTFVPPIAMAAAARRGLPFVVTFHSGGHSSRLRHAIRGVQRRILKPLLTRSAQLVGVSEFEAGLFAADLGMSRGSVRVVPNGAQIAPPSVSAPVDLDRPLVVSMGRLERYKGHHTAIDAFAAFRRAVPGARLRVLGEGPYKAALQEKVRSMGLQDHVEIGGIPPAQRGAMADLLASAALVVMLSEYEAHPVAALETIALGRPALALYATGFMEMIDRGELAGVAPGSSPEAIARAMQATMAAPASRRGRVGDWEECTDALLSIYARVLASPRQRDPVAVAAAPTADAA